MFWRVPTTNREILALLDFIGAMIQRDLDLPGPLLWWLEAQPRASMAPWIQIVDKHGQTENTYQGLRSVLVTFQPELLVLAEQLEGDAEEA